MRTSTRPAEQASSASGVPVLTVGANKAVLRTGDVVAGQRHGGLLVRELDLEDRKAAVAETQFTARQIEFEHAAEALVIERGNRIPVRCEAPPPVAKRFGIMQPEHFNITRTYLKIPDYCRSAINEE